MIVHDFFDDPLQPRYFTPAGSPPERFPDEDNGDANEANDEDDDFDDDDDEADEEDEDVEEVEDE